MRASQRPAVAFYCVSDSAFFPGAAGMVNSLRLLGHREPIYLLDVGLEPWQRQALAGEVNVVPGPVDIPATMLKAIAPLTYPAETMILIDADMVVVRSLQPAIEEAARGKIVAFENDVQRFVPEWGDLLGLGEARQRTYVSAGLLFLGGSQGEELLRLLDEHRGVVDFARSFWHGSDRDYPFLYGDQDVLNAILSTRADPDGVLILDRRLSCDLPFGGVELLDEDSLGCAYPDGVEPYILHNILPAKPWLEAMYDGVYSRLLRRCLTGRGLAVSVPEQALPLRMRTGRLARLERRRINAADRLGWWIRNALPRRVVDRFDEARRRRGAQWG